MAQLSTAALRGILNTVSRRASQVAHIRSFVNNVLCSTTSTKAATKTTEAFAEACRINVQDFDFWVSDLEASLSSGYAKCDNPATPLGLLTRLEDSYGAKVDDLIRYLPLSASPVALLDAIYATYLSTTIPSLQHFNLDILLRSIAPMWRLIAQWLWNGMPIPSSLSASVDEYAVSVDDDEAPLDPEFFIKRDRDVSWTDEDFWESGYILDTEAGCPIVLQDMAEDILEAGKAQGLLKGLQGDTAVFDQWRSLSDLVEEGEDLTTTVASFSGPICRISALQLRRVLDDQCGLEAHLDALDGIMYVTAQGAVDEWSTWLFDQVRLSPMQLTPTDNR